MKNKSFLNVSVNVFFSLILPVLTAIKIQTSVGAYGPSLYGYVALVTSAFSYVLLADFGIGGVVAPRFFKFISDNDKLKINMDYNTYKRYQHKTGTLILGIILFLVVGLYYFTVYKQSNCLPDLENFKDVAEACQNNMRDDQIIFIPLILMLNLVIAYTFLNHNHGLLNALQLGYKSVFINYVGIVISMIVEIYLMKQKMDFVFVLFIANMILIITTLLRVFIAKRNMKEYIYITKKRSDFSLSGMKYVFFQKMSAVINLQTDILVVSLYLTYEYAGSYSVYFFAANSIATVVIMGVQSLAPKLGNMIYSEDSNVIVYFEKLLFILSKLSVVVVVCLYFGLIFFINILQSKIVSFNMNEISLLCMIIFWQIMRIPYIMQIDIRGLYKNIVVNTSLEMILNIVLSLILGRFYGVAGILLGTVISTCIIEIMFKSRKILNLCNPNFSKIYFNYLFRTLFFVLAIIVFVNYTINPLNEEITGYLEWFILMVKCGVVSLFILFLPFFLKKIYFKVSS